MNKVILIILINFIYFTNIYADERNLELKKLFKLLETNDTETALNIEKKIWKIWSIHPSNNRKGFRLTDMLAQGELMIIKKDLNEAIKMFSLIISIDSNWAEAWNKRATALYLYGRYDESISDIKKVLKIEPRHFGAIIGLSLNNIELKNYKKALKSCEEAKKIYPTMEAANKMIPFIKELIKGQKT
tara:strand:- start:1394 stop:1954 length:561 start_codon:yes stop_codon:yes gene_type:complete